MGTEKWKTLVGNDNDYRALSGRGGLDECKVAVCEVSCSIGFF